MTQTPDSVGTTGTPQGGPAPGMDPVRSAKDSLRDAMRERLREFSAEEASSLSASVCRRVIAAEPFESAQTVMVYMPIPGEVDVCAIALRCFQVGKTVCVPRMDWKSRRMHAVEIRGFDDQFEARKHGIREPLSGAPVPTSEVDLVIVPGLAFDAEGNRVGRGAGFYDRFLADPSLRRGGRALAVGVGFDFQVVDRAPREPHDVKIEAVATDRRLICVSAHRNSARG